MVEQEEIDKATEEINKIPAEKTIINIDEKPEDHNARQFGNDKRED